MRARFASAFPLFLILSSGFTPDAHACFRRYFSPPIPPSTALITAIVSPLRFYLTTPRAKVRTTTMMWATHHATTTAAAATAATAAALVENTTQSTNSAQPLLPFSAFEYQTAEMDPSFRGENAPTRQHPVHYFHELDRHGIRAFIFEGKIYSPSGSRLDTAGRRNYVMGKDGSFYIMPTRDELQSTRLRMHHSSLLAGGPVACAGEIEVTNGQIKYINNLSGHYRPGPEFLDQVIRELEKQGIPRETYRIRSYTPGEIFAEKLAPPMM